MATITHGLFKKGLERNGVTGKYRMWLVKHDESNHMYILRTTYMVKGLCGRTYSLIVTNPDLSVHSYGYCVRKNEQLSPGDLPECTACLSRMCEKLAVSRDLKLDNSTASPIMGIGH